MTPEQHYPTPAEAAEDERQALLERLATPDEVARWLVPAQRRRRVPVAPVLRMARRAGRRP